MLALIDCVPEPEAAAGGSNTNFPAAAERQGGTPEEAQQPAGLCAEASERQSRSREGPHALQQRQVCSQKNTREGERTYLQEDLTFSKCTHELYS